MEIGGLLTLEEISLLSTVLLNPDSVLLAKNLNNYISEKRDEIFEKDLTYLDEKMGVQVCTPRVYFV